MTPSQSSKIEGVQDRLIATLTHMKIGLDGLDQIPNVSDNKYL